MTKQKKTGYESPASLTCELQTEAVICASTGIEDLTVKDALDWGWEE